MKLLFASSELYPLIKTGGLGDVAHSLPNALGRLGVEVRVVLPAYRNVLRRLDQTRILCWLKLSGGRELRILEAAHEALDCPLWLVDAVDLFDREGAPYVDETGRDWPDNPARFTVLSEAAAALATDSAGIGWRADVVHANDWQTGLLPAFLAQESRPPRTLFTIHNLAYDCQFDYGTFQHLDLPKHWWSVDHGEFYDRFSMLKSGLTSSDLITTVSPAYAAEIQTPDFGYGYASILEARADRLVGILNGIDEETWNPQTDPHLAATYHRKGKIRQAKRENRQALLQALDAPAEAQSHAGPLIGSVGRLAYQKGIDLLLDAIPRLIEQTDADFAVIGAGESRLEQQLIDLATEYPERVFCFIGYSESRAHLLEAGSDIFAMPSRYEPCGLNQMYSLRYGTPPVVRNTGGLADTVRDATARNLARQEANGFVFDDADADALYAALLRATELFGKPKQWMKLIKAGMREDHSWGRSAEIYLRHYQGQIP